MSQDILLKHFDVLPDGTVITKTTSKYWLGHLYPNGYYMIEKQINGKKYREYVHRIVATLYVPNPNNYKCINHIDGNKLNNSAENLEWCTHSHNMKHANDTGLRDKMKLARKVRCIEAGITFDSVKEATLWATNGKTDRSPLICYACNGKCTTNNVNTAYGFHWEYVK